MPSHISRSLTTADLIGGQHPGNTWYVNPNGVGVRDGKTFENGYATIQTAIDAASSGDLILVAPGDYDETVTITKDNLTVIGTGARTAVSIAPSTSNANAVVVDGTTANGRIEEVTLVNLNGDANGTGIGCLVKGNIRRFNSINCKWEAGDTTGTGVRLESTGEGSIGDVLIQGGEICWAATGLSIDVSGGGDPATEIFVEDVRFHNIHANHVINASATTHIVELYECRFFPLEAGTAPTGLYVDLRAGTSVGGVNDCYFPVASNGGKVLVDADVKVLSRFTDGFNTTAPT